MSSRSISPGAALLRSSRMFSLPPPLPSPDNNLSNAYLKRSTSATMPYPILQSITTPPASRSRGDWGFKRPLPLRTTTRSSTPLVRIKAVDTIEHVTDFASSADHTLTLQKFQELQIPIVVPKSSASYQESDRSVFDEDRDQTAISLADRPALSDKRWRFSGPWLATMAEGEFNKYIKSKVRPRRAEFGEYIKKFVAKDLSSTAALEALNKGVAAPPALSPSQVSHSQVADYLRKLRYDRPAMYRIVGEFLDLAPIRRTYDYSPGSLLERTPPESINPYAIQGPPMTHPSAGISYLRTASVMANHPMYGPQNGGRPAKARVLFSNGGIKAGVKLGVGGFVIPLPKGDIIMNQKYKGQQLNQLKAFDPTLVGGRKVYVAPGSAVVDSKGSILVQLDRMGQEAEFVAKEMAGEDVSSAPADPEPDYGWGKSPAPRGSFWGGMNTVLGGSNEYGLGHRAGSQHGG